MKNQKLGENYRFTKMQDILMFAHVNLLKHIKVVKGVA